MGSLEDQSSFFNRVIFRFHVSFPPFSGFHRENGGTLGMAPWLFNPPNDSKGIYPINTSLHGLTSRALYISKMVISLPRCRQGSTDVSGHDDINEALAILTQGLAKKRRRGWGLGRAKGRRIGMMTVDRD